MNSILRLAIAGVAAVCTMPAVAVAQSDVASVSIGPWIAERGARASYQAGTLVVRNGSVRTNRIYSDFVLRFEFRFSSPGSEGCLWVRSWFGYGSPTNERGYRIALKDKADGKDALGRVTADEVKMKEVAFHPIGPMRPTGGWREIEVRAERDKITVRVDGTAVSALESVDEFVGYIALQSSRGSGIEFRNLLAESLPAAQEPFGGNAYRTSEPGVDLPRAVETAQPFYPREPHAAGVQGTVSLELVVERIGSVGDIRVIKSLHPDLDQAAIGSTRKWRFMPGTRDGQPVDVIVTMEVAFRLRK